MTAQSVALLLGSLGITQSHSRQRVSNDNPYSESQFKTLKYHATFPGRFGSVEDARTHCQTFFTWYNTAHHHQGVGLHTPAQVYTGQAVTLRTQRQQTLAIAYRQHPERFVRGIPQPPVVPTTVWINRPFSDYEEPAMLLS